MKSAIIALAILLAAQSAWAGEIIHQVSFDPKDLAIENVEGRQSVSLQGLTAYGPSGAPRLPKMILPFSIPAGAVVTGVEVVSSDIMEVKGSFDVIPSQKPVPLPMPGRTFLPEPATPDQAIYGKDALYPENQAEALSTGSLGGYRIGHVAISPVRYNPVTKKLYLAKSLTLRVSYQENRAEATIPTVYQQSLFGEQARALVANPNDVGRFAPRVERQASKALPAGSYRSVIISGSASFDTVFARLAAWHTKKGWRDTVVNVSYIYANYSGTINEAKIRNFIIDACNTWGTVNVLLAGQGDDRNSGQNLVPALHAKYVKSNAGYYSDEDSIPSDLFYSDLDGTWNADGDNVYGELSDNVNMYSDVFVGRAPVLNVAGAQNFVAKTLNYEKANPGTHIKKMLLPTGILWNSYEERPTQRAIANMTSSGWVDDSLFERNGNLTQSAMVASFNDGRGLGHWVGHGNETGIFYNGGSTAYYTSTNAQAASNGDKQGVHTSIACFTGAMDEVSGGDCMAEYIINRVGGGAVGVHMNSRYGWGAYVGSGYVMGPSEMIDTAFMCNVLRRGVSSQGQAMAMAKNSWVPYADSAYAYDKMRWCLYELNCFGDPGLPILTEQPIALTVDHPSTVLIGYNNWTVTVTDPAKAPVRGALVCLMTETMDAYLYDTTDASGQVTLHPSPASAGQTMHVTVTARNHQPYEGTATVIAPSGPYVTHLKHTMSDAGGNNDGVANPGETVRLPTWVINYGTDAASGVVAKLRATGPNGSVTADSAWTFGTIAAGDSAYYPAGFGVYVSPSDTNGSVIPLTLECRDANDSSWSANFSLTAGTGVLAFNSRAIGGNGRLDPNENAGISIAIKNDGLGYSYNTQAVLRCSDVRITVTDSTASYGTLNPGSVGASGADSFRLSVGSLPVGTSVGFTLVMRCDGTADRVYNWSESVGDLRYAAAGPDGGGYYAVEDSDGVSRAPVYSWQNIRGAGGTQITPGDDGRVVVTLPFGFNWYGSSYTQISVCGNAWIGLGSITAPSYYQTHVHLPSNATDVPRPAVFALWDDVDPSVSGAWVGHYHDAANNRFIVQFDSVPFYGTTTYRNSFQVIFYDSTGNDAGGCLDHDVVLLYKKWQDRGESGIGCQNAAGTSGLDLYYDGAAGSSGNLVGFYPQKAVRITRQPESPSGVESPSNPSQLPIRFELGAAYPNPLRNGTTISFGLPRETKLELGIYNIVGQKVATLASGMQPAGHHSVAWNGRSDDGQKVAAGVYLVRMATPEYSSTRKLTVLR